MFHNDRCNCNVAMIRNIFNTATNIMTNTGNRNKYIARTREINNDFHCH